MRKAFTLIEILVVLAIISILASMLIPSLQNAMKTARRIQCTNMLKQVALANQMYCDDNKNYVPVTFTATPGLIETNWYGMLIPYINSSVGFKEWSPEQYRQCYSCPDNIYADSGGKCQYISYAYSWGVGQRYNGAGYWIRINKIPQPSQCMFVGDKDIGDKDNINSGIYYNVTPHCGAATWHNGGMNATFGDLHAEGLIQPLPLSSDRAFWNRDYPY